MQSLTQSKFEDFPLLIQIIRQNLQNAENSENMSIILNRGFSVLLEMILSDFFPSVLDPKRIWDSSAVVSIFESFEQKQNPGFQVIYPKIAFFQEIRNRVLFLDILISLVLVKRETVKEMFFGEDQQGGNFSLFGKLVIWQVFAEDPRERALLDNIMLLLLFDGQPESLLINKSVGFFSANRKFLFFKFANYSI
jgi:hypothetical protein